MESVAGLLIPALVVLLFAIYIANQDGSNFCSVAFQCCLGQLSRRTVPLPSSTTLGPQHVWNSETTSPQTLGHAATPLEWPKHARRQFLVVVMNPDMSFQVAEGRHDPLGDGKVASTIQERTLTAPALECEVSETAERSSQGDLDSPRSSAGNGSCESLV